MSPTLLAGFAGFAVAFWSYLKDAGKQFLSLLISTSTVANDISPAMNMFLIDNAIRVPVGERLVDGINIYVRDIERHTLVAYERLSKLSVYRVGWRFLLVQNTDGTQQQAASTTISWIRGTFDFDTFFSMVAQHYQARRTGTGDVTGSYQGTAYQHRRRFRVTRIVGMNGLPRDDNGRTVDTVEHWQPMGVRYIQYREENLGAVPAIVGVDDLALTAEAKTLDTRLRWWLNSKAWYRERGIPWRTSMLLEGLPGCGKSSFVRALAYKYDLPIESYDVTTMCNSEFVEAWKMSASKGPCIVLLEDIDRVFNADKNIKDTRTIGQALTLDVILNCVSGVDDASGIVLIVTANDVTKLDPALLRPGRLDVRVEFTKPDLEGRTKIAKRILAGYEDEIPHVLFASGDDTGAEFEQRCRDLALSRHWNVVAAN